eukprot:31457-Chlamydomonas_euryale.AAC.1
MKFGSVISAAPLSPATTKRQARPVLDIYESMRYECPMVRPHTIPRRHSGPAWHLNEVQI